MPGLVSTAAGVVCAVNTPLVQGAVDARGLLAAAVFWPGGGAEGASFACAAGWGNGPLTISSATPGLVMLRLSADGGSVAVTFASPTQLGGVAAVHVSVAAHGAACAPAPGGGTFVSLLLPTAADATGATVTATCALGTTQEASNP